MPNVHLGPPYTCSHCVCTYAHTYKHYIHLLHICYYICTTHSINTKSVEGNASTNISLFPDIIKGKQLEKDNTPFKMASVLYNIISLYCLNHPEFWQSGKMLLSADQGKQSS